MAIMTSIIINIIIITIIIIIISIIISIVIIIIMIAIIAVNIIAMRMLAFFPWVCRSNTRFAAGLKTHASGVLLSAEALRLSPRT